MALKGKHETRKTLPHRKQRTDESLLIFLRKERKKAKEKKKKLRNKNKIRE